MQTSECGRWLVMAALLLLAGCGGPLSASIDVQDGALVEAGASGSGWGGSIDCSKGHVCILVPAFDHPICLPLAAKLCERLR